MRGKVYPLRGNNYRSKFEKSLATKLHNRHVRFRYEGEFLNYAEPVKTAMCNECGSEHVVRLRRYLPDFYLIKQDIYIEAKGRFTADARTKMLNVIASHPKLDIRMVFQYDNWLTKTKTVRYSDWCEKHNIKYAIGEIPDEWLDGDDTEEE